jgi:hypothetical protein
VKNARGALMYGLAVANPYGDVIDGLFAPSQVTDAVTRNDSLLEFDPALLAEFINDVMQTRSFPGIGRIA